MILICIDYDVKSTEVSYVCTGFLGKIQSDY